LGHGDAVSGRFAAGIKGAHEAMRIAHTDNTRRTGFTLVELLVVVVIIALLVGLTTAVVVKALGRGNQARARAEISQLSVAIENFQQKFKVPYIPSRIVLCERITDYEAQSSNTLYVDSFQYLSRVFPRIQWRDASNQPVVIDWNGDNAYTPPATLGGHHCLVFFLGGVPSLPSGSGTRTPQGFSTNPANPAAQGGSRIDPFFEFPASRLNSTQMPTDQGTYMTYLDPWETPYAYFSAYKTRNGYNRYCPAGGPYTSDCSPATVWPYAEALGTQPRYYNPHSFQIISAGPNKVFGSGTVVTNIANNTWEGGPFWSPSNTYAEGTAGFDDITNFHDRPLGSGN
jgi:prepilin-type N-terminal cleavage/methylation domain-containing protein